METENRDTWQFLCEDAAVVCSGERDRECADLQHALRQPFPDALDEQAQTDYINALIVRYQALYARRIHFVVTRTDVAALLPRELLQRVLDRLVEIGQLCARATPGDDTYERVGAAIERVEKSIGTALERALVAAGVQEWKWRPVDVKRRVMLLYALYSL